MPEFLFQLEISYANLSLTFFIIFFNTRINLALLIFLVQCTSVVTFLTYLNRLVRNHLHDIDCSIYFY
jgi:cell division protein FtsL